jgi:hypothetical protein
MPSKVSFHRATWQEYRPERCAPNRSQSAQNGLLPFLSRQRASVFGRAINFCVHETKLSRYHLNS